MISIFNGGILKTIDEDGVIRWSKDGKVHREDGPAIIFPSGTKQWLLDGEFHRIGGPAVECPDGHREWYQFGKLHREDGPAIEQKDGSINWCLNDKCIKLEEYLANNDGKYPRLVEAMTVYKVMNE